MEGGTITDAFISHGGLLTLLPGCRRGEEGSRGAMTLFSAAGSRAQRAIFPGQSLARIEAVSRAPVNSSFLRPVPCPHRFPTLHHKDVVAKDCRISCSIFLYWVLWRRRRGESVIYSSEGDREVRAVRLLDPHPSPPHTTRDEAGCDDRVQHADGDQNAIGT